MKFRSILRRRKRPAHFSSNCTATTPSKAALQHNSGCCQRKGRSTKRSSSPRASTTGRRWVFTSSPRNTTAPAFSGLATIFALACASRPSWHWPVGVSVSNEIGYARAAYANPTWLWQIMPIVDKTVGKWYGSVNTTMNWGIHPTSLPPGTPQSVVSYYYRDVSPHGMTFGPAATITYQPKPVFNFGIEYYGYWGEFGHFVNLHNQQHQFFPVVNLFVSPKWEINFGAGWGATASTDHLIVKVVLGRYFNWGKQKTPLSAPPCSDQWPCIPETTGRSKVSAPQSPGCVRSPKKRSFPSWRQYRNRPWWRPARRHESFGR